MHISNRQTEIILYLENGLQLDQFDFCYMVQELTDHPLHHQLSNFYFFVNPGREERSDNWFEFLVKLSV